MLDTPNTSSEEARMDRSFLVVLLLALVSSVVLSAVVSLGYGMQLSSSGAPLLGGSVVLMGIVSVLCLLAR